MPRVPFWDSEMQGVRLDRCLQKKKPLARYSYPATEQQLQQPPLLPPVGPGPGLESGASQVYPFPGEASAYEERRGWRSTRPDHKTYTGGPLQGAYDEYVHTVRLSGGQRPHSSHRGNSSKIVCWAQSAYFHL